MNTDTIPPKLASAIRHEDIGFITNTKRNVPTKESIKNIISSLFMCGFMGFFFYVFSKGQYAYSSKGISVPFIFLCIMMFFSIFALVRSLQESFRKGGYFVGTPAKLIHFKNNKFYYYEWSHFTGNIEIDFDQHDLSLHLRKGHEISKEFIRDTLYLSGIEDIDRIASYCTDRIKLNDPTPSSISGIS